MKKTLKKSLSLILAIMLIFACSSVSAFATDEDLTEHTHTLDEGYVSVEPQCKTTGTKVCACTECGATIEEEIPANGHDYGEWICDVAPCFNIEGGKMHRYCKVCPDKEVLYLPMTAHLYMYSHYNNDASCTSGGTDTYICEYCGDEASWMATRPSLPHTNEDHDKYCEVCGTDVTKSCLCVCHKDDIVSFFFKVIMFFKNIFGQNQVCICGVYHFIHY